MKKRNAELQWKTKAGLQWKRLTDRNTPPTTYVQVYSNSNVGKKCSEKIIVGPQEVQNS